MRLFNLLFTLVLASTLVQAQTPITITTTDMPSTGDTIRYSITNDIQGQDPALTGANYTWDYSTLTSNSQRIDTFFSVTSTPFMYQLYFNNSFTYPTHKANYALRGQDFVMPPTLPIPLSITEVFNYKKNSTSKYENVGFGAKISGIPSSTRNIPIDVEYEFPLNYSDSNFSNSKFLVTIPTLAAYGQAMDRATTVEGWGSLITPLGTFNVLKVKSVLTKVDTFYLDTLGMGFNFPRPEEIEYKWLANNMSTPVLKVITTAGIVTTIEYQDTALFVGIKENELLNGFNVYPNPTKGEVTLTFNSIFTGNMNYVIKDFTGKTMCDKTIGVTFGKNNFTIDFAKQHLRKGIYFVELQANRQTITQKIVFSE